MADQNSPIDNLANSLNGPREVHGPTGGASVHPLGEQLAVVKALAATRAMRRRGGGTVTKKLVAPGSVYP